MTSSPYASCLGTKESLILHQRLYKQVFAPRKKALQTFFFLHFNFMQFSFAVLQKKKPWGLHFCKSLIILITSQITRGLWVTLRVTVSILASLSTELMKILSILLLPFLLGLFQPRFLETNTTIIEKQHHQFIIYCWINTLSLKTPCLLRNHCCRFVFKLQHKIQFLNLQLKWSQQKTL